jgi:anti-sigma B factor antagonist
MNLTFHERGDKTVAKFDERRLDAEIAGEFKKRMAEKIRAGSKRIAADLSSVEFVDSSGLGALVSSLKTAGKEGDVVVFGARKNVTPLFALTRMDAVFKMSATEEEALERLDER